MQQRTWFRYYFASRKVMNPFTDVIGFAFNLPNPSSLTVVLKLTQSLQKCVPGNHLVR
jgi:hypothetical protein